MFTRTIAALAFTAALAVASSQPAFAQSKYLVRDITPPLSSDCRQAAQQFELSLPDARQNAAVWAMMKVMYQTDLGASCTPKERAAIYARLAVTADERKKFEN